MKVTPTIDAQMKAAYAKRGIPLWVPPSEVHSYLGCKNWSEEICIELREWFASVWSMAFAAGYRKVPPPKINRADVYQSLSKMGYTNGRANELANMLVDGLPGLYKKGMTLSGVRL